MTCGRVVVNSRYYFTNKTACHNIHVTEILLKVMRSITNSINTFKQEVKTSMEYPIKTSKLKNVS
jgi:hypothetical protein